MIPDDILPEVFAALTGDSEGVILFGSYARGDHTLASDVDVVQISPQRKQSYSCGRISIAVYTRMQLLGMARHGDLFAAHIVREGKLISGPQSLMTEIQGAFVPRASYEGYRDELKAALALVDVPPEGYKIRAKRYDSLAQFLLRSWVYSLFADRGEYVFSMHEVATRIGDQKLSSFLRHRDASVSAWSTFRAIVELAEIYFGTTAYNPWGSPEAFLVNTAPGLGRILGLRLLNDAGVPLEYESHEARV